MLMSAAEFTESLRRLKPRVYVDGRAVESVADEPSLIPGVNAVGLSYDFALREDTAVLMRVAAGTGGKDYNRMLHVPQSSDELLQKLEAIRLICRYTGCAQRYLAGDAMAGILQGAAAIDAEHGTEYLARAQAYSEYIRDADLAVGIAMTDAKGDRSKRPHAQANPDAYVHIVERRADGIVISGAKAIVTGGPYMHELLVMPGRAMTEADAEFAVCCAVPIDVDGLTLVARPAGRPGEAAALLLQPLRPEHLGVPFRSSVFVPWERVFLAGEWRHSEELTYAYATHHRHTCIAARAGYGDLLIGAGTLMTEANGLDTERAHGLREAMTELIKIVEGFYACGVAASVYGHVSEPGRHRHARRGLLQHRQAAAGDADLRHAAAGARGLGRPDRHPARPRRGPQPGHRGTHLGSADGALGRTLREAHRRGALHRGPHRLLPGRLVFGDQPARRRLAGGDEEGDLPPLSRRRKGRAGGKPA
jgi:4-hydroxybutyryl-CoA dehydratase/vinylacetyl-CoA-Delta-isomerase